MNSHQILCTVQNSKVLPNQQSRERMVLCKFRLLSAVVALIVGITVTSELASAADHIDAPLARADLALDIGDIFVEQAPDNPDQTLFVVTANPAQVPGERRPWATSDEGKYRILIDNDGDGKRDNKIIIHFYTVRNDGSQRYIVSGLNGRALGYGKTGETTHLIGGGKVFIDVFDDPFFIDFQAVLDDLEQMGGPRRFCDGEEVDFLAGLNTGAIVIQIPSHQLVDRSGNTQIGVWADTIDRRTGRIIDRMGQPEVPTFFIEDDDPGLVTGLSMRDKYNAGRPKNDVANFGDQIAEKLIEFSTGDGTPYTEEQAIELVTTDILPDILRYDITSAGGIFEGNGRKLLDDGLDFALIRATGGGV